MTTFSVGYLGDTDLVFPFFHSAPFYSPWVGGRIHFHQDGCKLLSVIKRIKSANNSGNNWQSIHLRKGDSVLEEAPFLEVKLEPRISLKIENHFEMFSMLHSVNCMWHVFIFRDSLNPDHYSVHSFLVDQSGKLLIVTISETILPPFNWKVWHAETYCSTLSHSWCHMYKLHYFIDFFFL